MNKRRSYVILLAFWLVATLLNLNKAYHIDDVFHLEAAQWIAENPTQPMSGLINWADHEQPMYEFNQPPLYFSLIALVGNTIGYEEWKLHLFQSLFSLLAIFFFYKTCLAFRVKQPLILAAFLALGPAFLVNQNLMVDMPLLSLHLMMMYALFSPDIASNRNRYLLAALALSASLLIKYAALPLWLILVISLLLRKQYRLLWIAAIPLGALGLWSVFNYMEFGKLHMLSMEGGGVHIREVIKKTKALVICLGGITPFSIALFAGYLRERNKLVWLLAASLISIGLGLMIATYAELITEQSSKWLLMGLFAGNGLAWVIHLFSTLQWRKMFRWEMDEQRKNSLILFLWGGGMLLFMIIFAPFMATRHLLLVLPVILLLSADVLEKASPVFIKISLVLTLALGLTLGISDWQYADYYRKGATAVAENLPAGSKAWAIGHWGWQWYAKKADMQFFDTEKSELEAGDYLLVPTNTPLQKMEIDSLPLKKTFQWSRSPGFFAFFSVSNIASLYSSENDFMPWHFSKKDYDPIEAYQVE